MDWRELQRWLSRDLEGYSGEIAFRTALRTLPLVSKDFAKSWTSRQFQAPVLLAFLRSLIASRVALDSPDENLRPVLQGCLDRLPPAQAYDHIGRCIRALLTTLLSTSRSEQFEQLRRSIQVAKDGSQNVRSVSAKPKKFFAVDIWKEVERDIEQIDSLQQGRRKSLPPHAIRDRRSLSGAWTNLIQAMDFYDQHWAPWSYWLDYRLFGATSYGFSEDDWKDVEKKLILSVKDTWSDVTRINRKFGELLESKAVPEDFDEETGGIEEQNPDGLRFRVNDEGIVNLEQTPAEIDDRTYKRTLYEDLVQSIDELVASCGDNSSAHIEVKARSYQESLLDINQSSSQVLMVVRGEALRIQCRIYEDSTEGTDMPPLKDSTMSQLREVVGKHNVFVRLDQVLSNLDRALSGPQDTGNLLAVSDLEKLLQHPTAIWVISPDAKDALREVMSQAPLQADSSNRLSRRASESGKNLIRGIMAAIYKRKKAIGIAAAAVPTALYGIGKWAIANEPILLGYFTNNPTMHSAMAAILKWLHTLPLV